MTKKPFSMLIALTALVALSSGCIQTRAYLAEKPRVDQDIPGESATGPVKTRQVLVVEIAEKSKGPVETTEKTTDTKTASTSGQSKVVTEEKSTVVVHESNFTFPKLKAGTIPPAEGTAVPTTSIAPTAPVLAATGETAVSVPENIPSQYTVQKDDTLQKISKKLYGSYGKWTKIYDANKDKIKDPNFLKAGVVLTIPALEPVQPVLTPEPVEGQAK